MYLASLAFRMVRVTFSEEATTAWGSLKQHTVAARIRSTIGHAMLNCVNINSRSKRLTEPLSPCTSNNLLNGEIQLVWMFSVQ
jgi:hypothetical protein